MPNNNTAAAFIEALRGVLATAVAADGNYDDTSVVIVPDGTTALTEAISLIRPPRSEGAITNSAGSAEGFQEPATLGQQRRTDTFTIGSSLWVKKTGKADGTSSTFRLAMDRASALLDIVIVKLRDEGRAGGALDVGNQTLSARIDRYEYRPGRISEGWVVVCDFDIRVVVRVT